MLKNMFRVVSKYRILILMVIILVGMSIYHVFTRYYYSINIPDMEEESPVLDGNLRWALTICFCIFAAAIFISFEVFRKFSGNGVSEIIDSSKRQAGVNGSIFLILTLCNIVFSVIITAIVLFEVLSFYDLNDGGEYVSHIIKNMILNYFMITETAIAIGMVLSLIRFRFIAYALIIGIVYLNSPQFELMTENFDKYDSKVNLYTLVEAFCIMPFANNGFAATSTYGESLAYYRIFSILFWFFICVTIYLFVKIRDRKKGSVFMLISVCLFLLSSIPESDVNMNGHWSETAAYDQFYYGHIVSRIEEKKEKAPKFLKPDFKIKGYEMNIKINRILKAKVGMDVNRKSMSNYDFTLYHRYKVDRVYNEKNKEFKFVQKRDYIRVLNPSKVKSKRIYMEYEGYSPA